MKMTTLFAWTPGMMVATLGLVFLQSCNDKNPVVLKIGDSELRKSEVQAFITKEKNIYEINRSMKFGEHEFDSCVMQYIDNQLMIKIAAENGYTSRPDIVYSNEVMQKNSACRKESGLTNTLILKYNKVEQTEIEVGRERSRYIYEFETLTFDNYDEMKNILGSDTVCKNAGDFDRIAKKAASNGKKSVKVTQRWPYRDRKSVV